MVVGSPENGAPWHVRANHGYQVTSRQPGMPRLEWRDETPSGIEKSVDRNSPEKERHRSAPAMPRPRVERQLGMRTSGGATDSDGRNTPT